jgi:hypothetical protein
MLSEWKEERTERNQMNITNKNEFNNKQTNKQKTSMMGTPYKKSTNDMHIKIGIIQQRAKKVGRKRMNRYWYRGGCAVCLQNFRL